MWESEANHVGQMHEMRLRSLSCATDSIEMKPIHH